MFFVTHSKTKWLYTLNLNFFWKLNRWAGFQNFFRACWIC